MTRYTMLFGAVFFLPLATFVLVNSFFVIGSVETIIAESYRQELQQVRIFLEAEIGRLRSVSQAIVRHETLREFWYQDSEFNSGSGFRSLQEIGIVSGFFDHIVLISNSRGYVLTNRGSFAPEEFFTRIYVRPGWDRRNIAWNLRAITAERTEL
ncbi:MAG: hypothetical protein EA382_13720, partial [Spirochaetaceae bacterium]